jgi:hypothetical protein
VNIRGLAPHIRFPVAILTLAFAIAAGCSSETPPRPTLPHHPDPDRAVRACLTGIEAAKTGDPASAIPTFMAACSHLYAEGTCREAWVTLGGTAAAEREVRRAEAIESCSRAYCPLLPAPRPQSCQGQGGDADSWRELQLAIFTFDLGTDRVTAVAEALQQWLDFLASRPIVQMDNPTAPGCEANLTIAVIPEGVWLTTSTGVRGFVARCGEGLDTAAVAGELCRLRQDPGLACTKTAIIATTDTVPYGDLVAVVQLALQAGFPEAVVSNEASTTRPPPTAGDPLPPGCGREPKPCPVR